MWMCSFQCQSGITPYCTKHCSGLRMSTCCLPVRTHLVKACGYHKQHLHLTTLELTIKHQERTKNTNLMSTSLQEFMTVQVWVFTLEDVCWSWKSLSHLSVLSLLHTLLPGPTGSAQCFLTYTRLHLSCRAADQINIFHHTSALAVHPQMPCVLPLGKVAISGPLEWSSWTFLVCRIILETLTECTYDIILTTLGLDQGSLKRFYQLPSYLRLWQE